MDPEWYPERGEEVYGQQNKRDKIRNRERARERERERNRKLRPGYIWVIHGFGRIRLEDVNKMERSNYEYYTGLSLQIVNQ